ncbi:IS630 family transposase [Kyrpidia spormannii]|uniref:IS630 family transposase n=2 Tax=Kyrpidia spormannii TaxID=2055160 RepID=A0A2K8N5L1_9BACL|nr:IS630 family transposase [Kyrpidia spormannii]
MQSLYRNPPKDGRVICVDEFGPLSIQPFSGCGWYPKSRPDRLPATYRRTHGVRHLFAALDLKADKLYGHVSSSKKHQDILRFLKVLRRRYHRSERLYVVLDNFSPHKHRTVTEWAAENNVELVFTPTQASWLNRIECHFAPLRSFVLRGSHYPNHEALATAIRSYLRWRNKHTAMPDFYVSKRRSRFSEGALVPGTTVTTYRSLYTGGFFRAALPDSSHVPWPSPVHTRLGFLLSFSGLN